MLFLLLGFHLFIIHSQISSVTLLIPNDSPIHMYANSRVQSNFNNHQEKFNCALPNTYIYQQTQQQLQANTAYQINVTASGTYQVTSSTTYNNWQPLVSPSECVNNCTITITNNCPYQIDDKNYFNIITLYIGDSGPMSYRIDCDSSFKPFAFQWGLFILIIWMTVLIFFSSSSSKSLAFDGFGITLNYKILIGACGIILIGGVLGIFFMHVINIIVEVVCWILGTICVGACCDQVLFMFSCERLNKPLFKLKDTKFKYLRPIELISLFVGLVFTSAWWFTDKNWILNDIISCCIIVACVMYFKFISLRMTSHYFGSILLVEVIVALVLYFTYEQSYNNVILNSFNNPMQIQFPSITKAIDYKCSWLPITEIIFPAIFISYMRRFDKSKSSRVYIFITSIAFFFGCIAWAVLDAFTDIPVPLGIFIEPVLMLAVVLSSLQRNEIKVIWFGRFYDVDYKDVDDFKNQVRKAALTESPNVQIELLPHSNIFKGLRIGEERESENSEDCEMYRNSMLLSTRVE